MEILENGIFVISFGYIFNIPTEKLQQLSKLL